MRYTSIFLFFLIFCPFSFSAVAGAEIKPPTEGDTLPEIVLRVPGDSEQQQYLGVAGKESFTIPEIKAEVVLIEIFSMY